MKMMICTAFLTIISVLKVSSIPVVENDFQYDFPFVTREEWNAREPTSITSLQTPVPFVIIHHSYEPEACYNTNNCKEAMKSMQDYHQIDQGWVDIGYNFAVGSEGVVYEGRGWLAVGAHATGSNYNSIGIVLIGNWISKLPPPIQLESAKKLVEAGVELGFISPSYKLIGHRQVRSTECPGDRLFLELSNWSHFDGHYENIHSRAVGNYNFVLISYPIERIITKM